VKENAEGGRGGQHSPASHGQRKSPSPISALEPGHGLTDRQGPRGPPRLLEQPGRADHPALDARHRAARLSRGGIPCVRRDDETNPFVPHACQNEIGGQQWTVCSADTLRLAVHDLHGRRRVRSVVKFRSVGRTTAGTDGSPSGC
jgi:hypothetical protein